MSNKKTESIERVLNIATEMFVDLPYAEVHIAEIAARALCSSATIHAVFETKEKLFQAVLHRSILVSKSIEFWPRFRRSSGDTTLSHLIDHLIDRINGHCTKGMLNLLRSLSAETSFLIETHEAIGNSEQLVELVAEVERCIAAGLLRAEDPRAVSYLLIAGTGYEAMIFNLGFGVDASASAILILEAVLSPLVTDKGRGQVERYVARIKPRNGEHAILSLLNALRHAKLD